MTEHQGADQTRTPDRSVALGESTDAEHATRERRNPPWLVALALGLAAVLGVLLVALITGGDDSSDDEVAAGSVGGVECPGDKYTGMAAEYQGGGTLAASPALAIEELTAQNPALGLGVGEWRAEGPASDPATRGPDDPVEGSMWFVRRDGDKVTGRVLVVPATYGGTGWIATQATLCRNP
jgi:hypothetical protein